MKRLSSKDFNAEADYIKRWVDALVSDFNTAAEQHKANRKDSEGTFLAGWHQGSEDTYHRIADRMKDVQERLDAFISEAKSVNENYRGLRNTLDEALNSGDGTYRP